MGLRWLDFGLFTPSRRANGVTLQLNKTLVLVRLVVNWLWHDPLTVFILNWGPLLTGSLLNMSNAGFSSDDITIKAEIRSSVVGDLFGILAWMNVVPGVVSAFLSCLEALQSIVDGHLIHAKVRYLVVHGVRCLLWVFTTVATASGMADGVRLSLSVELKQVIIVVVGVVVSWVNHHKVAIVILLNIPGSILFLSSFSVELSILDILVQTEIGHEVVLGWKLSLVEVDNPLVVQVVLSPCKVFVGIHVVLVISIIWHEVVHRVRLGWFLNNPFVIQFLFRLVEIILGKSNVIISAEVGDWVVNVVATLRWLERGLHFVVKTFLGLSQIVLSHRNLRISTIAGDIVVDVPVWFLP